jgi:predicted Zn-dependent protease
VLDAERRLLAGDPAGARSVLEAGLAAGPDRAAARVLLARVSAREGDLPGALTVYRRLLDELDPRNLPALKALATAALAGGRLGEASALLERWRREDPEDPELGDCLEELAAAGAPEPEDRAVLPAPSPNDASAWRLEGDPRDGREGG